MRHPMLPAESLQGLGRAQRGGGVAAQDFETEISIGADGPSTGRGRVLARAGSPSSISSRARSTSPNCQHRHGEDGHRDGAGVLAEAFARLPIALGVAGGERPLAMGPRLEEIAGEVAHQGEAAAGDAGLHDATRVLRFLQERRGQLPRRPQFARARAPRSIGRGAPQSAAKSRRSWPRAPPRARRRPWFPRRRSPWTTSSPGRRRFEDAAAAGAALLRP